MKHLISLLISIFLIALISCNNKDETVTPDTLETIYTYGLQCGWCIGNMELNIKTDSTFFETSQQTGNCEYEFFNDVTDREMLMELDALLNFEAFKQIDINTHNVGFDGCDWYLKITQGTETHQIRYGYNDTLAIQSILPLIEKLEEVIEGF